jgi:DNA transformation protein
LRALGPDAAYTKIIATGTRPHFIGYYALVMGLQGRPWNDCQGREKVELRARFDAIKATTVPTAPLDDSLPSSLEDALNRIGIR